MVQTCDGCGSRVAMGFLRCPRCQAVAPSFAGRVKEEAVPKVTVNSGVSNAGITAPDEAPPRVEMRGEHGPELVKLPEGWTAAPAPADAPDYASMQHTALKEEAKSRGLPVSGSKADLAARLSDHDAAQAPEVAEQQGADV